jgi:hypothetical protein
VYDGPDVVAGQGERRDGERQRRREADYTEHEDPDDSLHETGAYRASR